MKVLLSIKPEFAQKIFEGTKRFEYRKSIFARREVTTVVVYATKPIGQIIGEFEIEHVLMDTPYKLWQQTKQFAGVKYHFYKEYFRDRDRAIAIKIGDVKKYDAPLDPHKIFDNFTPPQSFVYVQGYDQIV